MLSGSIDSCGPEHNEPPYCDINGNGRLLTFAGDAPRVVPLTLTAMATELSASTVAQSGLLTSSVLKRAGLFREAGGAGGRLRKG
jgi:hypothetical protein